MDNIKKAISIIPDRNLVGQTYPFFGKTARSQRIVKSVERLNSCSRYDGLPLDEYPKERFEDRLRNGMGIRKDI